MIKLGRYELVKRVARGGMAELLLARQAGPEGFEKLLVIKRLLPSLSDQDDIVRMFLNEARIAARLTHPNIVQIFDLGKSEGEYYIAMEYVAGRDLRAVQKAADKQENPLPYELSTYVLTCVCRGLHHAHTLRGSSGSPLGLVHRDVSPHNVLLSWSGDVKLADFGIAKATALAAETQAGVLKGKFAYMSPEQIRGEELDSRSDVFSAGILLHELICWQRLFRRESDFATIRAVESEPIPPPSALRDDVPDVLENVIMRALNRDADRRYDTAQEMQMDLESVISDLGWRCGPVELAGFMTNLFWRKLSGGEHPAAFPGVARAAAKLTAKPLADLRPSLPKADEPLAPPPAAADAAPAWEPHVGEVAAVSEVYSRAAPTAPSGPSGGGVTASAAPTNPRRTAPAEPEVPVFQTDAPSPEEAPPTVIQEPDFDDLIYDEPAAPSPAPEFDAGSRLQDETPPPMILSEAPLHVVSQSVGGKRDATDSVTGYQTTGSHYGSQGERSLHVLLVLGIIISLSLTITILVLIAISHRGG